LVFFFAMAMMKWWLGTVPAPGNVDTAIAVEAPSTPEKREEGRLCALLATPSFPSPSFYVVSSCFIGRVPSTTQRDS